MLTGIWIIAGLCWHFDAAANPQVVRRVLILGQMSIMKLWLRTLRDQQYQAQGDNSETKGCPCGERG